MARVQPRRRRFISDVLFDDNENVQITTDAVAMDVPAIRLYDSGFIQYSVISFRVRRLFDRPVNNRPCVIKPNDHRRVWTALGGDPRNLKSTRLNTKQDNPSWILSFFLGQPVFVKILSTF